MTEHFGRAHSRGGVMPSALPIRRSAEIPKGVRFRGLVTSGQA